MKLTGGLLRRLAESTVIPAFAFASAVVFFTGDTMRAIWYLLAVFVILSLKTNYLICFVLHGRHWERMNGHFWCKECQLRREIE